MSRYDQRVTADPDGSFLVDTAVGAFRVTCAEAGVWEAFPVNNGAGNWLVAASADEAIACLIGGHE
jgi:hypothetical protein